MVQIKFLHRDRNLDLYSCPKKSISAFSSRVVSPARKPSCSKIDCSAIPVKRKLSYCTCHHGERNRWPLPWNIPPAKDWPLIRAFSLVRWRRGQSVLGVVGTVAGEARRPHPPAVTGRQRPQDELLCHWTAACSWWGKSVQALLGEEVEGPAAAAAAADGQ